MSMHNNYYFIKHLSKSLSKELVGLELATCFSQNKDELVMGFCNPQREFWIKSILVPQFQMLYFPQTFQRSKKNSIDLFSGALDSKVIGVRQFLNERAFSIQLEHGYEFLFKLFGNRSNIILIKNGEAVRLFQKKYPADLNLNPNELDRPIDQGFDNFTSNGLNSTFPTFGKEGKSYLEKRGFEGANPERQWQLIQMLLQEFESSNFYITVQDEKPSLLLYEPENLVLKTQNPIEVLNEFFFLLSKHLFLDREKNPVIRDLEKKLRKSHNYIQKCEQKLYELEHKSRYEEVANIIMANLHQIPPRVKRISLHDFYRDESIEVKLNENLTPQKNAENYYRKSKNQKIEVQKLKENISEKEDEVLMIESHLEAIQVIENVKELRKYLKTTGLNKDEKENTILPFRKFKYGGFDILVGKNAANNDILTQKYAFKEDLWLHARDVSGSHVVVKYQSGKNFPQPVIEKAASLAAFYSQRKTDTLCPVIYTPKKFVRKPKGSVPGAVVVDRENVIMVTPGRF